MADTAMQPPREQPATKQGSSASKLGALLDRRCLQAAQEHALDVVVLQNPAAVIKLLKPSCRRAVNGSPTHMDMSSQAEEFSRETLN